MATIVRSRCQSFFGFCVDAIRAEKQSLRLMEATLNTLLEAPSPNYTEEELNTALNVKAGLLNTIPASKLAVGFENETDLLKLLDPSENPLPYLHVLLAQITSSSPSGKYQPGSKSSAFAPGSPLWSKMLEFTQRFHPVQVRYSGAELRRLADLTVDHARYACQPEAAIAPLRSMILRLDPCSSTLTSTHLTFTKLCIEARKEAEAVPVLANEIVYLPSVTKKTSPANGGASLPYLCSNHPTSATFMTTGSGLTSQLEYQDVVQYYLYSGLCYIRIKDWDQATFHLEAAIVHPFASNTSKIQVEAYKKWVFVNLHNKGHSEPMPKQVGAQAAKQYHALGKAYEAVAEVFEKSLKDNQNQKGNVQKGDRLKAELDEGLPIWLGDENGGLAYSLMEAYRQFSVCQLGKIYDALPVAQIADMTSPSPDNIVETGNYIAELISSKKLNAVLSKPSDDPGSWVMRFTDHGSNLVAQSKEDEHLKMGKAIAKTQDSTKHLSEMSQKMTFSKEFISDAKKKKKNKGQGPEEENAWVSENDHDEDMMADLA